MNWRKGDQSLTTFRLGQTGAHNLSFLKIFKNIEQPTRYNIKTNSIKKSGEVHFELERTLCQQSSKYISLYNTFF